MDAIGFVYVSLGSSTVKIHDSLGSRPAFACSQAGFSSQNSDRAWGVYYRRTAFCYASFLSKWLNAKDIHKEMFPVYAGKCLSRKAVHNWIEKFSQGGSKVADHARRGAEVAETTVKRHTHTHIYIYIYWRFRHTGKAMGNCINVGGGYVEK
jgi:hypothetical protein